MIARTWHGRVSAATEEDRLHHYESEFAKHLRRVAGFCGALPLRHIPRNF
jgi:hypothetical protein